MPVLGDPEMHSGVRIKVRPEYQGPMMSGYNLDNELSKKRVILMNIKIRKSNIVVFRSSQCGD